MTPRFDRTEVYAWEGPPRISVSTEAVEHNGQQWLQHIVEGSEGGDGAVVVAVFEGKILLVEHYRPVTGSTLTEFPRGFGGPIVSGRTPEEHASLEGARELKEEAGLVSRNASLLGYIWPDSGILANKVAVVCIEPHSAEPSHEIDGEIDSWSWVLPHEMARLIQAGQIRDGITLAAYALWSASTTR